MNESTIRALKANPKVPRYCWEIDKHLPLDRFISYAVMRLREGGIETFESCEGGLGHSYPVPAVRFWGNRMMGFRAVSIAADYGLPVDFLRRYWRVEDGDLVGPSWEMTFARKRLVRLQLQAERDGLIK
jgi:hypothetical protein